MLKSGNGSGKQSGQNFSLSGLFARPVWLCLCEEWSQQSHLTRYSFYCVRFDIISVFYAYLYLNKTFSYALCCHVVHWTPFCTVTCHLFILVLRAHLASCYALSSQTEIGGKNVWEPNIFFGQLFVTLARFVNMAFLKKKQEPVPWKTTIIASASLQVKCLFGQTSFFCSNCVANGRSSVG